MVLGVHTDTPHLSDHPPVGQGFWPEGIDLVLWHVTLRLQGGWTDDRGYDRQHRAS